MEDISRNRHRDNPRSEEANAGRSRSREAQRAWCLRKIRAAGRYGCTTDELAQMASDSVGREVPPNRISGRVSELKAAGLVIVRGRRRTRTGATADVVITPEHRTIAMAAEEVFMEHPQPRGEIPEYLWA